MPGHHRDLHASRTHAIDEVEVRLRVEEVLRDGAVRARLHLANEVRDVFVERTSLRMRFGIGRHLDVEVLARLGANELDELVGIAKLTRRRAHSRGKVPAKRDELTNPRLPIVEEELAQRGLAVADAGEVGSRRNTGLLRDGEDRLARAIARRSTRAVRHGEEARLHRSEVTRDLEQLRVTAIGLRREELEAVAAIGRLRHGLPQIGGSLF